MNQNRWTRSNHRAWLPAGLYVGSAIVVSVAVAAAVAGQTCEPGWNNVIGQLGLNSNAWDMMEHDGDLYVVGQFTMAGGQAANRVARWDGASWHPMSKGMDGQVSAIELYNGEIHVSGGFSHADGNPAHRMARWDGAKWHAIHGLSAWNVGVLQVFGNDLYVAGDIITAGGQPVNNITRWDGANWHPAGGGLDSTPDQWGEVYARVFAMNVFNGDLIVGGQFEFAGGQTVNRIARWDGEAWHPIGDGLEYSVHAIAEYDGSLIAGGDKSDCAFCQGRISRWEPVDLDDPFGDGQWTPMGSILSRPVRDLAVYNGDLYAGGLFLATYDNLDEPLKLVARWNTTANDWEQVDGGATDTSHPVPSVATMAVYDDALVISGILNSVGPDGLPSNRIALWASCPDEPGVPGDLNGDGSVGVPDLLILLGAWGPCADPGDCPADLNGDGSVGVADLLILLGNWG